MNVLWGICSLKSQSGATEPIKPNTPKADTALDVKSGSVKAKPNDIWVFFVKGNHLIILMSIFY